MKKRWARWYDACQAEDCVTPDKPHHGNGLCTTCYYRQYTRKASPRRTTDIERARQEVIDVFREGLRQRGIVVLYKGGVLRLVSHGRAFFEHKFAD